MRINEQHNGNYIFTLGTLPTYVCRGSKKNDINEKNIIFSSRLIYA